MTKSNLTRLLMGLCLGAFALSATACNTSKGVGRDIERTGEKMQDAADDARR